MCICVKKTSHANFIKQFNLFTPHGLDQFLSFKYNNNKKGKKEEGKAGQSYISLHHLGSQASKFVSAFSIAAKSWFC